jgi:hypothetical protein
MSPRAFDRYFYIYNWTTHFHSLSSTVRATIDEQKPFFCNNISLGFMGASSSATQGIDRYVVCDVIDLTCCVRRLNSLLLGIRLTSFKNCTPTLGSLNRNAMNNLLATLLAPNVARQNVVFGMCGFREGVVVTFR